MMNKTCDFCQILQYENENKRQFSCADCEYGEYAGDPYNDYDHSGSLMEQLFDHIHRSRVK
jgi:hypothetical protein